MRPRSQAFEASARVLKKRAAHSHLSMRIESMKLLSYKKPLDQALKAGWNKPAFRFPVLSFNWPSHSFRLIGSSKLAVGAGHAKPVG
jgi:hypothetical protein